MACVSCGVADPTHIFEFNEEFGLIYVRLIKGLAARKQSASDAFAAAMGHMAANCPKD
jgi:hypothetical protein